MSHWFDDLAKSAGGAEPSRRAALRTAGAGFLGFITLLTLGGRAAADDDDDKKNGKAKCPAGLASCGGACRDVAIDPDNCGGCGVACSGGAVCRKGACVAQCPPPTCLPPTCPPGLLLCNGKCVVSTIDPSNCGACGRTCSVGQTCVNGGCATTTACPPGQTICANSCANMLTDANNCGTCGNHCSSGVCANGVCVIAQEVCAGKAVGDACSATNFSGICTFNGTGVVCIGTCAAGFANCNGTLTDGCETNTRSDLQNCGTCGHACAAGSICSNGLCVVPDALCSGRAAGDACSAPNYNGTCITTGSALICSGTCAAGFANCDNTLSNGCETQTTSNAQNCGACGVVCAAGETCVNGLCGGCPAGQARCNGVCFDPLTDRNNCGACENACDAYLTCLNGICRCPPPLVDCNGICLTPTTCIQQGG